MVLDRYVAIADYDKQKKNECSLTAGQTVEVVDKNQNGERHAHDHTRTCIYIHVCYCRSVLSLEAVIQCIYVHPPPSSSSLLCCGV